MVYGMVQVWVAPIFSGGWMLFGWGERKVIKTKNLTPQTNPLGTRRCFVHPWRLGGSTVWGDEFPPLVVACPPAGRTIPHPWSSTTPPLGAWLRLPPPQAFLVSVFFGRGSHPSPALRQALVRWAVNQAKQRGRGRLRRLPWVLGGPGGRNGIAGDETRRLRLHCCRTANVAVCPSRCKCGGPAAL